MEGTDKGNSVCPQDQETAAAIGRSSYNALMERMVALTGRASLTPAVSHPSQQPAAAAKTPAVSATGEEGNADEGPVAKACEGSAGLVPQHTATPLQTEGGSGVDFLAPSSADAGAAEPVSGPHGSTAPAGMPAAESKSAAASEQPEAAGKSGTDKGAAEAGVHAADTLEAQPTSTRQGLSEADELDFALKLSLDADQGSAAPPKSTAAHSFGDCIQPLTAVQSSAKDVTEGSEPPPEQPAGAHAAVTPGTPTSPLSHAAEGHHPTEETDDDFVVVEPEEAPGVGFEQVDMPKMGSGSAGGSEELTSAALSGTTEQSQQASDLSKETAEGPTPHSSQRDHFSPCDLHDVSREGLPAAVQSAGAAAEHISATTDPSSAESKPQPGSALDERAMALLAALPKPSPAEGCSAQPPELEAAGLLQQHLGTGGDAEKPTFGGHQKVSDDVSGRELGTAAASQDQIARMGSTQEAYLIQSFLDNAPSQLTEHGLVSLHQVCSPNFVLFQDDLISLM